MKQMTEAEQFRSYLRIVAPDITDADIERLHKNGFIPKPTEIAFGVRLALRDWNAQ